MDQENEESLVNLLAKLQTHASNLDSNLDEVAGNTNYLKDISLALSTLSENLPDLSTADLDALPKISSSLVEIERDLDSLTGCMDNEIREALSRMEKHLGDIASGAIELREEVVCYSDELNDISESLQKLVKIFSCMQQDMRTFFNNPMGGGISLGSIE